MAPPRAPRTHPKPPNPLFQSLRLLRAHSALNNDVILELRGSFATAATGNRLALYPQFLPQLASSRKEFP
jgi:hypothetical protein